MPSLIVPSLRHCLRRTLHAPGPTVSTKSNIWDNALNPSRWHISGSRIRVQHLSYTRLVLQSNEHDKFVAQKVLQKTKDLRIKTIQKSIQLREETISKSKELKENITKIIPPEIHENVYTVPNFLTLTRLVSAPIIGYLIVKGEVNYALALFAYSCVTDFLDGFIARKFDLKSIVGSIIDPLADKTLMIICTICLAKAATIPPYLAVLILGRDIFLTLGAMVIRYISLPAPKTFLRFWDFSIISAEVHPTMISKVNTALQMLYIGSMMVKPVLVTYLGANYGTELTDYFLDFTKGLEWTVAATTVLSGLSYVFSKTAVKVLTKR